jgi:hypothetical protein
MSAWAAETPWPRIFDWAKEFLGFWMMRPIQRRVMKKTVGEKAMMR